MPIQEIILFYPGLNREIRVGVKLLERVIREEKRKTGKSIKLSSVKISGSDIDSEEACVEFQQKLEEEIAVFRRLSDKRCATLYFWWAQRDGGDVDVCGAKDGASLRVSYLD